MNHFFAYLDRMKLIRRWGLMRNTVYENDMEHSMQTALIAHGLAVLGNVRHGRNVNPETVLTIALYHDVSEVITGDLPTPVKYKTPEIQGAYQELESHAKDQLLDMLTQRQRMVLRLHFGMEDGTCYSLEDISVRYGVSKERIRQIERQAMDRLKKLGANLGLEDFLE